MHEFVKKKKKILGCAGEVRFVNAFDVNEDVTPHPNTFTVGELEEQGWKEEEKAWEPEHGKAFYYLDDGMKVRRRYLDINNQFDRERVALGNAYQTEQIAQDAAIRVRKVFKGE